MKKYEKEIISLSAIGIALLLSTLPSSIFETLKVYLAISIFMFCVFLIKKAYPNSNHNVEKKKSNLSYTLFFISIGIMILLFLGGMLNVAF